MNMSNKTSNSGTKKILLISYHFPPSTAVGGLRIADFAKYLPLYGWKPSVLTVKDDYLQALDPGRLKDVSVEKIIKAGHLPTVIQGYLKLKSLYYSVLRRRSVMPKELQGTFDQSVTPGTGRRSPYQKFKRFIISLLTVPDTVIKAVREIKRDHVVCILTSSPPYSVHLVGLLVKMITGVKWVADFRDPWISSGRKRLYVTSTLSIRVERWLEKNVIEKADLVLTTTEKLRDHFTATYRSLPKSKFLYMSNGFSPEIADQFKHLTKYETFTLTYAGSFYIGRTPEPTFKAIRSLVEEGRISPDNIRVKLVGNCQQVDGCPTSQLIHAYGLDSAVEVVKTVPYFKALEIIKKSHIALLFAPDQPYQIPAKVFEYMGLGTKILALTEKGATWDLITSTGAGTAFYSSDIDGIKDFILRSMSNGAVTGQERTSGIQRQFDRRSITGDLARHLDRLYSGASLRE
jgi:hypothetical protein